LWFLCQRYNLKAIHNRYEPHDCWNIVVVPMSKIQSESNSQQKNGQILGRHRCGSYVKDTIWKQFTTYLWIAFLPWLLWFLCQRYNLKAIHNPGSGNKSAKKVVVPMSKIQSESNSQRAIGKW